jgi:hypothetical protein
MTKSGLPESLNEWRAQLMWIHLAPLRGRPLPTGPNGLILIIIYLSTYSIVSLYENDSTRRNSSRSPHPQPILRRGSYASEQSPLQRQQQQGIPGANTTPGVYSEKKAERFD